MAEKKKQTAEEKFGITPEMEAEFTDGRGDDEDEKEENEDG